MSDISPLDRVLQCLEARPGRAPVHGDGVSMACCPAHNDTNPSLAITNGPDDEVLIHCHAGCKTEDVVHALGLEMKDLFPQLKRSAQRDDCKIVATYDYRDENNNLLFQVCRLEPKSFRQRVPNENGGWNWSVKGVRKVPYRLPELLGTPIEQPIVICEGEKDVDSLRKLGIAATTNAGGAGKWLDDFSEYFKGRPVIVLPDNDDAGASHAEGVSRNLYGVAKGIRVIQLPGVGEKGDVTEWISNGGTREQLQELVEATPDWAPSTEWPELKPLGPPPPTAFPIDALPAVLSAWAEAEAIATQTPVDLPALLAIAVCSASIAKKVEVSPWVGWTEPVNLYIAILLEPGNRKSAVFSDATAPMRNHEKQLIEDSKREIARKQSIRRRDEKRLSILEKKAAGESHGNSTDEAIRLAEELADLPPIAAPRLMVDDVTSEKLAIILAEQGGRIASMSPEGGVFDLMAGMYSKSGMPQFGVYLMGHSGDDLKVERVSRPPVYVESPAITAAYTIQPEVIEGLAENSAFRGRGLLARFLYSVPESRIGERDVNPPPMPDLIDEAYHATVLRLLQIELSSCRESVCPTIHLIKEAQLLLEKWMKVVEEDLGDGGRMELIRDWGAKLSGLAVRLATVFHCVEHVTEKLCEQPISAATLANAIRVAEYAIKHAEVVLSMMSASNGVDDNKNARIVWQKIRKLGSNTFSKRELHRSLQCKFSADDLDMPLNSLVSHGYVRLIASPGKPEKGRPKSPEYEVNPVALVSELRSRQPPSAMTELTECETETVEAVSVTSVIASDETENDMGEL